MVVDYNCCNQLTMPKCKSIIVLILQQTDNLQLRKEIVVDIIVKTATYPRPSFDLATELLTCFTCILKHINMHFSYKCNSEETECDISSESALVTYSF